MYLFSGFHNLKSACLLGLRFCLTLTKPRPLNSLLRLCPRRYDLKLLLILSYHLFQLLIFPRRCFITVILLCIAQRRLLLLQLHMTLILLQHYNILLLHLLSFLLKPRRLLNLVFNSSQLLIQHLHRCIRPLALWTFRSRLLNLF